MQRPRSSVCSPALRRKFAQPRCGLPSAGEVTSDRSGFTLLEVIIATAVFLGTLTAIMQIFRLGNEAELLAQLDTEAVMRAESLMAEMIAAVIPLETVSGQPFADGAERWQYDVLVDTEADGLLRVTVDVNHVLSSGRIDSTYRLVRLVRDPQLWLDAALESGGDE